MTAAEFQCLRLKGSLLAGLFLLSGGAWPLLTPGPDIHRPAPRPGISTGAYFPFLATQEHPPEVKLEKRTGEGSPWAGPRLPSKPHRRWDQQGPREQPYA